MVRPLHQPWIASLQVFHVTFYLFLSLFILGVPVTGS